MSLHVPDHVQRLKELQATHLTQKAWWLSSKKTGGQHQQHRLVGIEPILTCVPYSDELKEDLQAALTSTLDTQPKISTSKIDNTQPPLRTSETHPIK